MDLRTPRPKQGSHLLGILVLPYCQPPGTEGDREGSRCSGCYILMPSALLGWKYRGVRAPPPGDGVTRAAP